WAPGLIVGLIGLLMPARSIRFRLFRWLLPGLAVAMLIQIYINACVWDWWGGASYGPRRLCFLLAPAAIGWAEVLRRSTRWLRFTLPVLAVLWGFFTMSAFRWGVDDLTLLLTGKADGWRPTSAPATVEEIDHRWENWRNGFRYMRVPGFALVQKPRPPHRRAGLAILVGLAGMIAISIAVWKRYRWCRIGLPVCVIVYTLICIGGMIYRFPQNTIWRDHWYAVAMGRPVPPVSDEPIPEEYDLAVRLMMTVNQIKATGGRGPLEMNQIYYDGFPDITLTALVQTFGN
ncbi:hypothetical protein JXA80_05700, partial [bacterium]|nr:hypothetical protein [candidate division CSSED10-310 bacterium]